MICHSIGPGPLYSTNESLAALTLSASAAVMAADAVQETDIVIPMADGACDAALFYPAGTAAWPGCLIITDALGLRPAFRDMGRRLAAEGYAVLVPNPFYRTRKAPVLSGPFDFGNADDRAKLVPLTAPLTTEVKTRDGAAWIAYLDTLPQVKKTAPLGVSGYCMGGPYTMFTAAAVPDRVGAAGSFHGGNLVTDKPDSPHLLGPKIKASYYFAVAMNDGTVQRSGGSCRFGKGRVRIGDPVKSMPKPGTERAVIDCATNLEQQIGAFS